MLPTGLKAAYFFLLRYPMQVSSFLYRTLLAPTEGTVKVHLGPGQTSYLAGWYNVDGNFISARLDVWADLRNKLPFRDGTVDAFYSHHVIEHLPDAALPYHFREMFRCLKPGGVIRVGGPNGDMACRKFVEGDSAWFWDYPDPRQSLGGRFANFILCRGEHRTILTESYLKELAGQAGFVDMAVRRPILETGYPELFDAQVLGKEWEATPETPHTILFEARKP